MLKPEYDESLETDGQNFTAMRRVRSALLIQAPIE
jgi:hypothetical protein